MSTSKYRTNLKFPEKLWQIVNECVSGAIGWGIDGKTIVIDSSKFENEFLDQFSFVFKTKNFLSFIRQLNLYGFRKFRNDRGIHEFGNDYFIRERKDLLKFVNRNPKLKTKRRTSVEKFKPEITKNTNKGQMRKEEKSNLPQDISTSIGDESKAQFMQNISSYAYNLWGNASSMDNNINPLQYQFMENRITSYGAELKSRNVDWNDGKETQPTDTTTPLFRNIVFVPVPAYCAMYPGFYGSIEPDTTSLSQK